MGALDAHGALCNCQVNGCWALVGWSDLLVYTVCWPIWSQWRVNFVECCAWTVCSDGAAFLCRKLDILIRMGYRNVRIFVYLADIAMSSFYNLKHWETITSRVWLIDSVICQYSLGHMTTRMPALLLDRWWYGCAVHMATLIRRYSVNPSPLG